MKYRPNKEIRELQFEEMDKYYKNNNKLIDNNPNFISEYFGEDKTILFSDLSNFSYSNFLAFNEKVSSLICEIDRKKENQANDKLDDFAETTIKAISLLYELNMRMGNRINYLEEEIEKLKTK